MPQVQFYGFYLIFHHAPSILPVSFYFIHFFPCFHCVDQHHGQPSGDGAVIAPQGRADHAAPEVAGGEGGEHHAAPVQTGQVPVSAASDTEQLHPRRTPQTESPRNQRRAAGAEESHAQQTLLEDPQVSTESILLSDAWALSILSFYFLINFVFFLPS